MRDVSQEILDLVESTSYKTVEYVYIEDADGNWVNLSNLEGYDWVHSLNFRSEIDTPVTEGTLTLYRDFYFLSLSPMVEKSKINRDAEGVSFKPLLNLGRRIKVEVGISEPSEYPGEMMEVFLGEIQRVDWSSREGLIDIQFNCMLARLRDSFMLEEYKVGGIGLLTEDANVGDQTVTVFYDEDVALADNALTEEEQEMTWIRRKLVTVEGRNHGVALEEFEVEAGQLVEFRLDDYVEDEEKGASIFDGDGNVIRISPEEGTVYVDHVVAQEGVDFGIPGTWTLTVASGATSAVRAIAWVSIPRYPVIPVGSNAIISNLSESLVDQVEEDIYITDAQRLSSPDDDQHIYELTLEDPLSNSYPKVEADRSAGSYVGIRVEFAMRDLLSVAEFGHDDWSIDLYLDSDPDFVIGMDEIGHEGVLSGLRGLADQLGWEIDFRYYDDPENQLYDGEPGMDPGFYLTLRDPERDRVTRPIEEEASGSEVKIAYVDNLSIGDEICFLDHNLFEIRTVVDVDYPEEDGDTPKVYLDEALSNTYPTSATVAKFDYLISEDNILDVSQIEIDKSKIRNVVKTAYIENPLKPIVSEDDIDHVLVINEDSRKEYGYLPMELTKKATPNLTGFKFAHRLASYAVDDLAYPKADQRVEIRLFPFIQEGDILVFAPNKEFYDTYQVFAVVGFEHDFTRGITEIYTRGRPAGGFLKWHEMGVTPGGAPAVRQPSEVKNLSATVSLEQEVPPRYRVDLSWNRTSEPHSFYEIRYRRDIEEQWTYSTTEDPGHIIRDLEPAEIYYYAVRVVAHQGGERSEVTRSSWTQGSIETDALLAEDITDVTLENSIKQLRDGSVVSVIDVRWTPPVISSYSHGVVYYREQGEDFWASAGTAYDHLVFNPNIQDAVVEIVILATNWSGERFDIEEATIHTIYASGMDELPPSIDFIAARWGADRLVIEHEKPSRNHVAELRHDTDFGT